MSKPKKAAQGNAASAHLKYEDMSRSQRIFFIGKVSVFFLTFGFAYPNIFME